MNRLKVIFFISSNRFTREADFMYLVKLLQETKENFLSVSIVIIITTIMFELYRSVMKNISCFFTFSSSRLNKNDSM